MSAFYILEAKNAKEASKGGNIRGTFEPEPRLNKTKAKADGTGGGREYISGPMSFLRADGTRHAGRVQLYIPRPDGGASDREFTPIDL